MRKFIPIIIVLLAIFACQSDPSKSREVIDEETYKQMFMEFAIVNQLDQKLLQNRSREELREIVYEHYGVSEEEFRISHEYYEQQLDDQLKRIREMTRTMRSERDSLNTIDRKYKDAISENELDSLRQELLDSE